MSKVYLAARYSRHPEMRGYRDDLEAMGHKVTARWIDCHTDVVGDFTSSFTQEFLNANPEKCGPLGQHDIDDLDAAEWVISFTGGGLKGGRHVEFGYALATGKRLVVVGPRENVFHTLASVEHFEDWPAARAALAESTVEPVRADPASDDLQVLGEEHAECVAGYHLLRIQLVERTRELAEARAQVAALGKQVERQNRLLLGADQGLAEFQGQRDKAIGLLHRLVVAAGCTWDPLQVPAVVDEAEGWIRDYMGTREVSP